MTCLHEGFLCHANVQRITDTEGGPVIGYAVDLTVTCDQCGEKFAFLGLPIGSSPDRPMVSLNGTELRAPLQVGPLVMPWARPHD